MYFWHTKKLAEQLKSGKVSQWSERNYYLAASIITIVFSYANRFGESQNIIVSMTELGLVSFVITGGIFLTFQANQGDSGQNYLTRMVLLSLPILMRLIVGFIFFGVLIALVIAMLGYNSLLIGQWQSVFVSTLFQVVFFWRLAVHLRFINR